ncbi:hypothetical protein [Beggiatoa leptomitoformis]|uniref:Rubredoxin-like domain-containing protein n=1 Tax=Beggiatoa leptomitoformis TaxID=288004 RepID=A0A650GCN4_9GAMM|nr:hypothetical protein [Beggiatoa leptomitoformis]QGX03528.1 hypothetical protein AL038_18470 [Beggiatoa leptomitoformis]QGX04044.1 hypothetical protein BLE401_18465 [Beggiatoa leptomitoformis]
MGRYDDDYEGYEDDSDEYGSGLYVCDECGFRLEAEAGEDIECPECGYPMTEQ